MATTVGPGGAVGATPPTNPTDPTPSPPDTTDSQGTPPTADPVPVVPGTSDADKSAKQAIKDFFDPFGLTDLATWAWDAYLNGTPIEQVLIDAQQRPEWKARFPAMDALAAEGHAMSADQYIEWEKRAIGLFQQYGLPKGFYDDPMDFKAMLESHVSPVELESRLQLAAKEAFNAPQEVKDALRTMYGDSNVDPQGALTAYWLDPTKALPVLEQHYVSAQIAAQAKISKFGQISTAEAERLAALGVDQSQAVQGFQQIGQLGQVTTEQMAGEQALTQTDVLNAAFAGDTAAQRKIAARQEGRVAAFKAGGQFTSNQSGKTGIGTQES